MGITSYMYSNYSIEYPDVPSFVRLSDTIPYVGGNKAGANRRIDGVVEEEEKEEKKGLRVYREKRDRIEWNERKDRILSDLVGDYISYEEMAEFFDTSVYAVQSRMIILKYEEMK